MPSFHHKYYWRDIPQNIEIIEQALNVLNTNVIFSMLYGDIYDKTSHLQGKGAVSCVTKEGKIYLNTKAKLSVNEWAYVIAHGLLHLAFGHFDKDKIPGDLPYIPEIWNLACDIYVTRFLKDIGMGGSIFDDPAEKYTFKQTDERKIYEYLLKKIGEIEVRQEYGTNSIGSCDMIGLDNPIVYKGNEENRFEKRFSYAITHSVKTAVSVAGGRDYNEKEDTAAKRAAGWFMRHYPLLGGLAASFKIIEDVELCNREEIHIAAVNAEDGEIYINPAATLTESEWRFVLGHEYLHAGLMHHKRNQGRDHYLWNIACDYVINDWLREMDIGDMPKEGLLYDESLHGMSAEAIYDIIVKEFRKFRKHATFRGYGKGDIVGGNMPRFEGIGKGVSLDEFFKNSLREGLDFQTVRGRGFLPAGLVETIRALSMPPIPWEVELGKWFDEQFPPLEKHRTYARPSRRQGSTPDIPRPSYRLQEQDLESRTFGVVVDTSGSVSTGELGQALGSIASYAISKDVHFVRLIFCDAQATDAGYLAPEDIGGRLEVTGRGGTVLQPGVDALKSAKDFPKTGPILIITDGAIEDHLVIGREHAFLLTKGGKLPFKPKGKVFYFGDR